MKTWKILLTAALGVAFAASAWAQQTTLRIFTGGQQRPDVMRKIADEYQKRNPNVKVEVEVGGATSEAQQQYLSTVLSSKDSVLDVILIDVIRPAQWAAQGWAEPLDAYLGADKAKMMARYLKAYADANQVNGKVVALPYFADSQFLYYRKDLLEKYKRPVPKTWDEMMETAKIIMDGEKSAAAAGLRDRRRADRGHRLHVPRAAVGRGQRAHEGRQAQPRHAAGEAAVPALRPDEAGGRAAEEHRRDPDRPHPHRHAGGQPDLRHDLGLRLEPARERRRLQGQGQDRRRDAAARPGRQERDLHRRLAARRVRVLEEQAGGGEVRALAVVARGVEDAGDPGVAHAGVPERLQGSGGAEGQPVVRRRAAGRRRREVAAGVRRSTRRCPT